MRRLKLFILSLFFLAGCDQHKSPEGIIGQQKMVGILSDLHIMDGYISTLQYPDSQWTSGQNHYSTIYKKHNVSRATFEKSLKYYSLQPTLLDSMYTQVENILLKKEIKMNKVNELKLKKLQEIK